MIDLLLSLFRPPPAVQVAALCLREGEMGPEVMMVKSLERGIWILPKGWPMPGKSLAEAAQIEAWEEAGIVGTARPEAIALVPTIKRRSEGPPVTCKTHVFRIDVSATENSYPEARKRKRGWMPLPEAAQKAGEPAIADLLAKLAATGQGDKTP